MEDQDIKYGGGQYRCDKCGQMHYGSTIHYCEDNIPHIEIASTQHRPNPLSKDGREDEMKKAIQGMLAIAPLWLPTDDMIGEHEGEGVALQMAYIALRKSIGLTI
jgi:hypothetical protein